MHFSPHFNVHDFFCIFRCQSIFLCAFALRDSLKGTQTDPYLLKIKFTLRRKKINIFGLPAAMQWSLDLEHPDFEGVVSRFNGVST